jgi:hypothetical protein
MAYSDYGGYAYRNGKRVENRSDCTITPEGDTFGVNLITFLDNFHE